MGLLSSERYEFADDRRVGAEAANPGCVGKDEGVGGVGGVVLWGEEAAERGAGAEEGQEVRGGVGDFDLFGIAFAGEGSVGDPDTGELIELRGALAELVELEGGEGRAIGIAEAGQEDG